MELNHWHITHLIPQIWETTVHTNGLLVEKPIALMNLESN